MILRKATVEDIPALIQLRLDYLREDKGSLYPYEENTIKKQMELYCQKHIPNESFVAILAEYDGVIAATAYLAIVEKPASPVFINGITGTLLNVLTYPQYRGQGVATMVLKTMLKEAKRLGVSSINLSATESARGLYIKLGFKEIKYTAMNIKLI